MELTEEQLRKDREPIPFSPTKRLERDDVLYVTEEDIAHPIYGYAKYHKEYGVIDLRGYRKGYEPRLEIRGIYTPNAEDIFRLQTGKLPPYQPTTTGDKLLAEMRRLGVHKAFRIDKPEVSPQTESKIREAIRERIKWQINLLAESKARTASLATPSEDVIRIAGKDIDKTSIDAATLATLQDWQAQIESFSEGLFLLTGKPIPPAVKVEVLPISVVEYDRRYSLEELRRMARQEGLSPSGSKKEIAARLIARGIK